MDKARKERLEKAGYQVGSAADFLGLTPAEAALVEVRVALTVHLKKIRKQRGVTQQAIARAIGSSQSRVAKIEAGDPSVSLDLIIKASYAAGATTKELAKAMAAIEGK
ncbi:MAG TPA: helix-turn-helix transcriptional regulator [Blastocatellia bacterium]|nr:helix-turn-helix transcriptional regulator [Blastocatellia bacterium]